MPEKHLALLVELPATYVADIIEGGDLHEYRDDFDTETEFILNCIGEPGVVRVRMEIAGDKDSEIVEVWGYIREASIVDAGRGWGDGTHLTDEQLAKAGSHKLLRDEDACEWCEYHDPLAQLCGRALSMRGHGYVTCARPHGHDGHCA